MDLRTFNKFRSVIYQRSGVTLGDEKQALVSARIGKRMRSLGLEHPRDYLRYVLEHEADGEMIELLDSICTNYTSFFRESAHFDFLERIMSEWIAQGQQRFRLWSAASSSGEEPYTIALVLLEVAQSRDLDMKILATDLSTKVLKAARRGLYEQEKVKSIPPVLRERYFIRKRNPDGIYYQVGEELKQMVLFRRLNLSTPPFPMRGPLDVVFCRNVMIYFDNQVRIRLLGEINRLLKPGGYLIVGHTESLAGIRTRFQFVQPSIYMKSSS